ncbi:MAG: hypothetical protein AAF715_20575 [Myxococcota bacterium]
MSKTTSLLVARVDADALRASQAGKARYTRKPTPIAQSVPRGIERRASLRSPLMPTPAMIPVTAGKNTAKTRAKGSPSVTHQSIWRAASAKGTSGSQPPKNETRDAAIATMTTYCTLIARSALLSETAVSTNSTAEDTAVVGTLGNSMLSDSVKPTM